MRPLTSGVRPMTAVRSAGYTSSQQAFDPLNMGTSSKGPAPALETNKEDTYDIFIFSFHVHILLEIPY